MFYLLFGLSTGAVAGDIHEEVAALLERGKAEQAVAKCEHVQAGAGLTKEDRAQCAQASLVVAGVDGEALKAVWKVWTGTDAAARAKEAWAGVVLKAADDAQASALWPDTRTTTIGRQDADRRGEIAVATRSAPALQAFVAAFPESMPAPDIAVFVATFELEAAVRAGPRATLDYASVHPSDAAAQVAAQTAMDALVTLRIGGTKVLMHRTAIGAEQSAATPVIAPGTLTLQPSTATWTAVFSQAGVPVDGATRARQLADAGLDGFTLAAPAPGSLDLTQVCLLPGEALLVRVVVEDLTWYSKIDGVADCGKVAAGLRAPTPLMISGHPIYLGSTERELLASGLSLAHNPDSPDPTVYLHPGPQEWGASMVFFLRRGRLVAVSASTSGFDDAYEQSSSYNQLRADDDKLMEAWTETFEDESEAGNRTCRSGPGLVQMDHQVVGLESGDPSFDVVYVSEAISRVTGLPPGLGDLLEFHRGACGLVLDKAAAIKP